jgi:hypothetical protein
MFVVTLRAERGTDGIRALRATLKFAWRRFGLRAISAYETETQNQIEKPSTVEGAGGRKQRKRATKGGGDIDKRL